MRKTDMLRPQGNEKELLVTAKTLGFEHIILLYDDPKKASDFSEPGLKVTRALLLTKTTRLAKPKGFDTLAAPAHREWFENKTVKYLLGAHNESKPDKLYQRRAGLDAHLCRLARESKTIVFDASSCADPILFGRMLQNARLCRKFKVDFLFATLAETVLEMRAAQDLEGTARLLKLL